MKRAELALLVVSCLGVGTMLSACGGSSTPPQAAPSTDTSTSSAQAAPAAQANGPDAGARAREEEPEVTTSRTICTGRDINLDTSLIQKVCEIETEKEPKYREVKTVLEVKALAGSPKIAPGEHVDIVLTYTNKGKLPLALDFMIDPVPRFSVEAYDAKRGKRVDMPKGEPPPPPKDATEKIPATRAAARVIVSPYGIARVKLGWDAVRTKWAPEKYKGTPLEMGYPRKPAGPLPAGKYQLRIVTPLVHVMEGPEHEFTEPKIDIEVGK